MCSFIFTVRATPGLGGMCIRLVLEGRGDGGIRRMHDAPEEEEEILHVIRTLWRK